MGNKRHLKGLNTSSMVSIKDALISNDLLNVIKMVSSSQQKIEVLIRQKVGGGGGRRIPKGFVVFRFLSKNKERNIF